ncbi:hypothetical protein [Fluviispira multicolorata]|uniref:Uncharacterized protein n=1 Tax=Fluviispira multicolorata TaxID=2654512 RepID=A0A833N5F7_9BACT|nr:hypothetical protein [Fluviispira multicolorata]KAB8027736.1 hypothetical protein GCL57_14090 [Fluviispira multicolorata]
MYKKMLLACSLFCSINAFAANESPILTKKSYSGYVMMGYNTSNECEVYNNKVLINVRAGEGQVKQVKEIALSGNIKGMIEDASRGPLRNSIAPVDASSTMYSAIRINTNGSTETVNLGHLVANTWQTENQSVGSFGLRNLLDKLCN